MLLLNYSNENFATTCQRFLTPKAGDNPFQQLYTTYTVYSNFYVAEAHLLQKELKSINRQMKTKFNGMEVAIYESGQNPLRDSLVAVLVQVYYKDS